MFIDNKYISFAYQGITNLPYLRICLRDNNSNVRFLNRWIHIQFIFSMIYNRESSDVKMILL